MRVARSSAALVAAIACSLTFSATALDNGAGLLPPMGWSTWCSDGPCYLDYCSEDTVKQSALALKDNGMFALGYTWVVLDDCWAAGARTANRSITWDVNRFPSGIPALVDWLHSRNFSFGLYTSVGNRTCSSGGRPYPIPGSEDHYQQDMNTFAAWNVDYVKADWCGDVQKLPWDGYGVGGRLYKELSAAVMNTTPSRSIYIMGVAALLFLGDEVPEYMNGWRASTDHHDNWLNTVGVLATVQIAGVPGRPGAWSDMDVLMTGGEGCPNHEVDGKRGFYSNNVTSHCPGMTDEEYVTEYTLWNLMQSPLLVATDVRNVTAIMRKILFNERFISIHQDTRTPPGRYAGTDKTCNASIPELQCQVWVRPLADGSVLAALWNAELESSAPPTSITLDFNTMAHALPVGWNATTVVEVEDLWAEGPSKFREATSVGRYTSPVLQPHSINAVVLHPISRE